MLARHCELFGRDPREIERSMAVPADRGPDEARRQADALHAEGVTQFTIGVTGPDYPDDLATAMVAWRDSH